MRRGRGRVVVAAGRRRLLLRLDDDELARWSDIGQAISPVAVFLSGIAFLGITVALLMQGRELRNQREELTIAQEDRGGRKRPAGRQARSSELAMRELHTDLIKMAIEDSELRSVWPAPSPGAETTRKDHYCNLILNFRRLPTIPARSSCPNFAAPCGSS